MKFEEAALDRAGVSVELERFETESGGFEQVRDFSVEFGWARPRIPMNVSLRTSWEAVHHKDSETGSRHRAETCRLGERCCHELRGTGLQDAQREDLARQLLKQRPLRHLP